MIWDWGASWLEAAKLEDSAADGKQILVREFVQPCIGGFESMRLAGNRKLDGPGIKRAIVIQNSEERFVRCPSGEGESFDEIGGIWLFCLLGLHPKKSTVDQDRHADVCHDALRGKMKAPFRGRIVLAYERNGYVGTRPCSL